MANIWRFPTTGVPPNHSFFLMGFSPIYIYDIYIYINHPFGGTPIDGNPHIALGLWGQSAQPRSLGKEVAGRSTEAKAIAKQQRGAQLMAASTSRPKNMAGGLWETSKKWWTITITSVNPLFNYGQCSIPRCSMYGIFTYIYHKTGPKVNIPYMEHLGYIKKIPEGKER